MAETAAEAAETISRTRCKATETDYYELFLPFALKSPGSFCTYNENEKAMNQKKIQKHMPFVKAAKELADNLSLTKVPAKKALARIGQEKKESWKFQTDDEVKAWVTLMWARVHVMLRHTQQAIVKAKGKLPEWLAPVDAGSEVADSEQPDFWWYGWDAELGKAWRKKSTDSINSSPEFTDRPLEYPESGLETDPMRAVFDDGSRGHIQEFTAAMWRLREAQPAQTPKGGEFGHMRWSQIHEGTDHTIVVAPRKDRMLLMSMYEQSKQILQIRVDEWGDESEESINHARDLMIKIAKKYLADEIEPSDLKDVRDIELKKVRLARRSTSSSARQAATKGSKRISKGEKDGAIGKDEGVKVAIEATKKIKRISKGEKVDNGAIGKDEGAKVAIESSLGQQGGTSAKNVLKRAAADPDPSKKVTKPIQKASRLSCKDSAVQFDQLFRHTPMPCFATTFGESSVEDLRALNDLSRVE